MAIKKILLKIADKSGLSSKIPRRRLDAFLKTQASSGRTLDLGGGDKPYRRYFPNSISADIEKTAGVDVVADAHNLSVFKNGEFDCVLCTEVLEHLHTPEKAVREMYRVLKPGGRLILTTRFIFPLHNVPGDFFRFTRYGLEHLMKPFKEVKITEETKTLGAIAVMFERVGLQSKTLGSKILSAVWLILSKILIHLEWLLTEEYGEVGAKNKINCLATSGYYVVAVK